MGPSFFGDATFAFQADRKSFYMFRLLNRLEANLRNTIFIYPNNTRTYGSWRSASTPTTDNPCPAAGQGGC